MTNTKYNEAVKKFNFDYEYGYRELLLIHQRISYKSPAFIGTEAHRRDFEAKHQEILNRRFNEELRLLKMRLELKNFDGMSRQEAFDSLEDDELTAPEDSATDQLPSGNTLYLKIRNTLRSLLA